MKPVKDLSDIIASSRLLLSEAQLLGAGYYPDPDIKQSELEAKARSLCAEIQQLLPGCEPTYITELLDCYAFLHTIAFRQPLPQSVLTAQLARLFSAWQSGDPDIAESDIYALCSLVLRASSCGAKSSPASEPLTADQLLAFLSLRDKWLTTLRTHNCFPDVTTFENYRRLTLLTEEPALSSSDPVSSDEEKLRRFLCNRIEDLSTLSTRLLFCYRRYLLSLPPTILDFEGRTLLDTSVLEALSHRPDLHPYDREACRLALEYNRLLLAD